MKTLEHQVEELARQVDSPAALATLIRAMLAELAAGDRQWENATLAQYLEALSRWTEDSEGHYRGRGEPVPPHPTWQTFADMLWQRPRMSSPP
jgi:hypothetical protein